MIHPICFSRWNKSNRKRRQKNPYAEKPVFSKVNHEKASIRLSQNVYTRLEAARSQTGPLEFSGLGFVTVQTVHHETLYAVYDVVLLNVGSPGFTEIQAEDILPLLDRNDASNMKLWVHRHPIGNSTPGPHNWSTTDNQTIEEEPLGGIPELVKWSLSIVRTPEAWVGRLDRYLPEGIQTTHIPVFVDVDPNWTRQVQNLRKQYEDHLLDRTIPKRSPSIRQAGIFRL